MSSPQPVWNWLFSAISASGVMPNSAPNREATVWSPFDVPSSSTFLTVSRSLFSVASASWGGAFLAFSMITVAPALAPASAFSPTSGVGGVVLCGAACGSGDAGVWAWGVAGAWPGAVSD